MNPIVGGALAALVVVLAVLALRLLHWGDWWHHYNRYLQSRRWHTLSWQVKQRDNWTCRYCRAAEEWHMEAHHLRYSRWWFYALCLPEQKQNLVCLCEDCHAAAHGKRARLRPQHSIADEFDNEWPATCPECGAPMQIIRPGDCRCSAECWLDQEE